MPSPAMAQLSCCQLSILAGGPVPHRMVRHCFVSATAGILTAGRRRIGGAREERGGGAAWAPWEWRGDDRRVPAAPSPGFGIQP
ncbi:hypothetical protein GCM10027168_53740 [Streptomyces capparidis]